MRIELNGQECTVDEGARVGQLVRSLVEASERGVAVAVDGSVVPRSAWDETALKDGQQLEVLRAAQGG